MTLEKAKTMTRQQEAIYEQQAILTSNSSQPSPLTVDTVKHQARNSSPSGKSVNCSRCGRGHQSENMYPVKDATHHAFKMKGHFKLQCYSTKAIVGIVTSEIEHGNGDVTFLKTIGCEGDSTWCKTILVDGK